jgi:hypothetical protein
MVKVTDGSKQTSDTMGMKHRIETSSIYVCYGGISNHSWPKNPVSVMQMLISSNLSFPGFLRTICHPRDQTGV